MCILQLDFHAKKQHSDNQTKDIYNFRSRYYYTFPSTKVHDIDKIISHIRDGICAWAEKVTVQYKTFKPIKTNAGCVFKKIHVCNHCSLNA